MAAAEGRAMFVVPEWIARHCVVPDGFRKGEPFRLYDYQLGYVLNFYLVRSTAIWDPQNPLLASAFAYRRGVLVGPQKVGKNPLVASQVCVEFVGPALFAGWAGRDEGYACAEHGCACGWEYAYDTGEPKGMGWPTPKIQITAFSEDSTENTYDALRPMISGGPLADVLPKIGEEFIRHPNGSEDSRIDTVTSSNQSRLGQRVTFVPQDELGLWTRANKMEKLADTQYRGLAGMGGRASLTTNSWDPSENSVAQREFESKAEDVYRQYVQPPAHLSYANKAERRRIHLAVYPPDTLRENGGHVDLDTIEAEAADLASKDQPQAERFFGNRRVTGSGAAIDADLWDSLAQPHDVPAGTYIALGFDGSVSQDATALRACTADGYTFRVGIWERPKGAPLDWKVPRLEVDARLDWAFSTFRVGRLFMDPPRWITEGQLWQERYGKDAADEEIVQFFDTFQHRKFAPAVDRWRTALAEGQHTHDGDPVTSDHVKAARLLKVRLADAEDDGRTQYVLVKGPDRAKIDAAIADVLAYEAAMTMPAPESEPEMFVLYGKAR